VRMCLLFHFLVVRLASHFCVHTHLFNNPIGDPPARKFVLNYQQSFPNAVGSGSPPLSRCWHILRLVTTLVEYGAALPTVCDATDFAMLVRRCCGVTFAQFDTDAVASVRTRVHLLIEAADAAASAPLAAAHNRKRCEHEWLAALDALRSFEAAVQ
jgi:hypothetical protein